MFNLWHYYLFFISNQEQPSATSHKPQLIFKHQTLPLYYCFLLAPTFRIFSYFSRFSKTKILLDYSAYQHPTNIFCEFTVIRPLHDSTLSIYLALNSLFMLTNTASYDNKQTALSGTRGWQWLHRELAEFFPITPLLATKQTPAHDPRTLLTNYNTACYPLLKSFPVMGYDEVYTIFTPFETIISSPLMHVEL